MEAEPGLLGALRWQRFGVERPSPLYARLIDVAIADVERGGVCAEVMTEPGADPIAAAYVLRFLGAVHRLVLTGAAPNLAAFYPSAGGAYDPAGDDPAPAFLATVDAHRAEIDDGLRRPVQTNEVGRAAALLLGFLAVAEAGPRALRTLEIGASAGLNLAWHRFRYEGGQGGEAFGQADSPVRLTGVYRGVEPRLAVPVDVVDARGCDRHPIDAASAEGRLTLRSFVWPDQSERLALLDGAVAIAAEQTPAVDEADAGEWTEDQLARPVPDTATVVYHSIVWQYMPPETRERVTSAIEAAGGRATASAPIAWVRFEPADDPGRGAEVRVRRWPGGDDRYVARSGYHGRPVWPAG